LSQEVKGTAPTEEAKSSQVIGSPPAVPTEDRAAITAPAQRENQTQEIPAVRKTRLFFASVGTDGKVSVKGVIRSIPVSDSPLRDTILALLKGPTSQEVNLGMLNMIPVESRLLGAAVRGDTAYLDFNENFRFNTLGAEGLNAELRQVVYAATEFPTVKNVQFLIEGKIVQYLGSEGIRIDSPLSRQSFQE
jgi:germination protein M